MPPLFVAWLVAGSELSGGVHGALRQRVAAGEPRALALLHELGELARAGRELLHDRRGDSFGPLLDRAHDLRAALLPLRAEHVAMITTCRDHGASAQYAGSGGAIVGIQPAGPAWPALRAVLEALGCETLEVDAVK